MKIKSLNKKPLKQSPILTVLSYINEKAIYFRLNYPIISTNPFKENKEIIKNSSFPTTSFPKTASKPLIYTKSRKFATGNTLLYQITRLITQKLAPK